MTNYLAFDLEIAKEIPTGETNWKILRPLGISCAAFAFYEDDELVTRHWMNEQRLTTAQCRDIVDELSYLAGGYHQPDNKIVTWNGCGFDFDILAEESGMFDECKELALNHVDMMFHFFCSKGYGLSLNKAAKGTMQEGKIEGMSGDQAPVLWARGEYEKVTEYLKQDVKITLDLAMVVEAEGGLYWTSNAGRSQAWSLDTGKWRTVKEALALPLPDTSWMTDPWPREKFTGWMSERNFSE